MESKLTSGSILKPLPTVAADKFPIFVVMIPQESGIRAGVSFNENWPRRPRHLYQISHWRELRLLISREVIIQREWIYSREIQWRGVWSVFEGLTVEIELVVASKLRFILLRADFDYWGNWTSQVTEVLQLHSPPSSQPRRQGKNIMGPKEALSERSP